MALFAGDHTAAGGRDYATTGAVGAESVPPSQRAFLDLMELQKEGKIKHIGFSNFNVTMIRKLWPLARIKPSLNQVGYSIGFHQVPRWGSSAGTVALCRLYDIRVQAYSPSGAFTAVKGVLTDPTVVKIAKAHDVHPMLIALRWLTQQGIATISATSARATLSEEAVRKDA